jgi:predicted transcriptional regulator of viral defense system
MKTAILSALESLPYFTLEAVKQLLGDETLAAGTIRTALYRWMKTGKVIQLKKGVYMARHFFELHSGDVDFLPAVSSILIPQSYVSLEYALQRYGILTEVTYPVSAVTLKQTRLIENRLGTFDFHNIKKALYTGFTMEGYLGIPYCQATVAKALFDYLYFRPLGGEIRLPNYHLVEELRLNLEDITDTGQDEFAGYIETSRSRKMALVMENLRKTVWQR